MYVLNSTLIKLTVRIFPHFYTKIFIFSIKIQIFCQRIPKRRLFKIVSLYKYQWCKRSYFSQIPWKKLQNTFYTNLAVTINNLYPLILNNYIPVQYHHETELVIKIIKDKLHFKHNNFPIIFTFIILLLIKRQTHYILHFNYSIFFLNRSINNRKDPN